MSRRRALLSLVAADQAHEQQQGVNTSAGGFVSTTPELRRLPCTIQTVFIPRDTSFRQTPFSTSGSNASPRIDTLDNGKMSIYYGGASSLIDLVAGKLYDIVFVCDGHEQSVYVNGKHLATRSYEISALPYYNIGFYINSLPQRFAGDYVLHRHFDYALSASEIVAMHNAGNPAAYVLPAWMKYREHSYQSDFSKGVDGWYRMDGNVTMGHSEGAITIASTTSSYKITQTVKIIPAHNIRYHIRVELAEPTIGNAGEFYYFPFSGGNALHIKTIPEGTTILEGDVINFKPDAVVSDRHYLYFLSVQTPQTFKVKSITVTPVGCLAEYLPQNTRITEWLDSAKQLPEGDYLPPLRGSMGGYDLTADGTPEIRLRPVLRREIHADMMQEGITPERVYTHWFSNQTDATATRADGRILCNTGSVPSFYRPIVQMSLTKFVVGRKYRATVRYTLLAGDVHVAGFGDWTSDVYVDFNTPYQSELRQYVWQTDLIPYDKPMSRYNFLSVHLGCSKPHSEFSIDEIIIEEYE